MRWVVVRCLPHCIKKKNTKTGHLSTPRISRTLSQDTVEETHVKMERVKIGYDHVVQSSEKLWLLLFSFFPIREIRLYVCFLFRSLSPFTQRFNFQPIQRLRISHTTQFISLPPQSTLSLSSAYFGSGKFLFS